MYADLATKAIAQLSVQMLRRSFLGDIFASEKPVDVREVQLKLLHDLTEAGIDPALFDLMLSSELDRKLKKQFGVAFFTATVVCTGASFAVIIFNAINHWGISDIAITALIVETPIQFIGLLYIIARNLFPQRTAAEADAKRGHIGAAQQRLQQAPKSVKLEHRKTRPAPQSSTAEPHSPSQEEA
ncbi:MULTISPECIES: hypothetical protein [unclassified Bradyrhizobium]|uniref:hypothetical protein n=1 Tax=unclassified Bradyrhizobium TaxID=2631580 RepID=UPI002916905E|nr:MULTISPECIES: hypothetical protein [unclassified Bradyrhizobium]